MVEAVLAQTPTVPTVRALAQASAIPSLTTEILLVFGIILIALVLFIIEPVPIDIVALTVLVSLIVLEPWTRIDPQTGVSGFSNPATITVLAMFVLSEGIRKSGLINAIASKIADEFVDSPFRQLLAVLGLSGTTAGFINNTPVVAIMIPMVNTISEQTGLSPSKLLLPVSYASMLGGMLTVIGTSTNILASDISGRLLDQPFSMFEFTQLGVVVLMTGIIYLLTVGNYLTPERITVSDRLFGEFEMTEYLTEIAVREESAFVGMTVHELLEEIPVDVDVVQLVRDGVSFTEPLARKELRPDDLLVCRIAKDDVFDLVAVEGLDAPGAEVTEEQLDVTKASGKTEQDQRLVEVVISPDAPFVDDSLDSLNFHDRYHATVLAIRRGGEVFHARMTERPLRGGDTLLIQATEETVDRFGADRNFILARELIQKDHRTERIPVALGIVAVVVALAALDILSTMVSALAGIVAMVATGCVKPNEVYRSVDWSVIFLLAGVIPLGISMERTGAAEWLAAVFVHYTGTLEPVLVLALFYLFTALVTEVVTNNASVVLMIPVAVDTASAIGAEPFSFVLAVTFAASTAMLTPIGYQTNLMVYGPGGYRFTDYLRVGGPLQLVLTVVTTAGIAFFWGV